MNFNLAIRKFFVLRCVAVKMEVNNVHFRHFLLYCFKKGKQATEAHKKIYCVYGVWEGYVYGDDALTIRICQKWFAKFHSGDFNIN